MAVATIGLDLTASWQEIKSTETSIAGIVALGYADFIVQPTGAPSDAEPKNKVRRAQGDDFAFTPGAANAVYVRRPLDWPVSAGPARIEFMRV